MRGVIPSVSFPIPVIHPHSYQRGRHLSIQPHQAGYLPPVPGVHTPHHPMTAADPPVSPPSRPIPVLTTVLAGALAQGRVQQVLNGQNIPLTTSRFHPTSTLGPPNVNQLFGRAVGGLYQSGCLEEEGAAISEVLRSPAGWWLAVGGRAHALEDLSTRVLQLAVSCRGLLDTLDEARVERSAWCFLLKTCQCVAKLLHSRLQHAALPLHFPCRVAQVGVAPDFLLVCDAVVQRLAFYFAAQHAR